MTLEELAKAALAKQDAAKSVDAVNAWGKLRLMILDDALDAPQLYQYALDKAAHLDGQAKRYANNARLWERIADWLKAQEVRHA
ncbi:MAG: hypothetical protein ABIH03_01655 [Pseudomonadota bacterium]